METSEIVHCKKGVAWPGLGFGSFALFPWGFFSNQFERNEIRVWSRYSMGKKIGISPTWSGKLWESPDMGRAKNWACTVRWRTNWECFLNRVEVQKKSLWVISPVTCLGYGINFDIHKFLIPAGCFEREYWRDQGLHQTLQVLSELLRSK